MKVEIGKRLKRLRLKKGFTQKEFAAMVAGGLDYTYIGKIERGEQLPSLKILMKISEALSVPVESFFRDEPSPSVCGTPCSDLKYLIEEEKGCELLDAFRQLHEDDIRLVTEIIRVLSRHRHAAKGKLPDNLPDDMLLAAEEGVSYEKK